MNDKFEGKNLTAKLYRFLKMNDAFYSFKDALKTKDEGRAFYGTLEALRFDPKGKKERLAPDPLKWLYEHNDRHDQESFLRDFFNIHIYWADTNQGSKFWKYINEQWHKYYDDNFATSITDLVKDTSYSFKDKDIIAHYKSNPIEAQDIESQILYKLSGIVLTTSMSVYIIMRVLNILFGI